MRRLLRAKADYRRTLLRNQLTSLVLYEQIKTTHAKAKSLVAFANKFFNRVKVADLNANRFAHSVLLDKGAVKKLFEQIIPAARSSTFVSLHRIADRSGDSASMSLVRLITLDKDKPSKPGHANKTKEATPSAKTSKVSTKKTSSKKDDNKRNSSS